jgi:uncharacterized phage protein gp47/JayE
LRFGLIHAQPTSNQDIILKAISEKIESEGSRFANQITYALVLDEATSDALQALQTELLSAGLKLTTEFNGTYRFRVQVSTQNMLVRINQNHFTRELNGAVGITITNVDGLIIDSMTFNINASDTISRNHVNAVQTEWSPSKFSEISSRRFYARIQRFVEPVLITSAVATTVYLLYNIRSQ